MRKVVLFALLAAALVATAAPSTTNTNLPTGLTCCDPPPACPPHNICPPVR